MCVRIPDASPEYAVNRHEGLYGIFSFHQPFWSTTTHSHTSFFLRRLSRCICRSSLATTAGVCYEPSRFPLCQASWSSQMFYKEISHVSVTWEAEIYNLMMNTALSESPHISNCRKTTTVIPSPSAYTPTHPAHKTHPLILCSVGDAFLLVASWSEFARMVRRYRRYSPLL